MAKNRKTITFRSKYGQYAYLKINLTEGDNNYEVRLDKIITYMDKYFDKEPYRSKTRFDDKITAFLEEELIKEGKKRYAEGCNACRTFNNYFKFYI